MEKYNPKKIEAKWQEKWGKEGLYKARDFDKRKKFYVLIEFPYPSGDGLHVGHCRSYSALDAVARKKRMEGKNVLFPIGWDAFGLPAENYAIKMGLHPSITVAKNIENFRRQIKSMGFSFDWSREINTTDPEYYKWTQWIFLQFFKKGLAYQAEMPINWCPSCLIGLANEEVVDAKCERCKTLVEKRKVKQWMLKITDYADRLIEDLKDIDYPEIVKAQQINWIGKSEGATIKFQIQNHKLQINSKSKIQNSKEYKEYIEVFTTRPDTIFGATYMVLSPEHEQITNSKSQITNWDEVQDYINQAKKKSDLERTIITEAPTFPTEGREVGGPTENRVGQKTGVELKGIKAINPANGKEIPIWVADYVLSTYGTGAIMAVPCHDQRDFEFTRKYNLPILQTVALNIEDYKATVKSLELLNKIYKKAKENNTKVWLLGGLACAFYAGAIYRSHNDLDLIAKDEKSFYKMHEIFEKLGLKKIREKKVDSELTNIIFKVEDNGPEVDIGLNLYKFGLTDNDFEENEKELNGYKALVLSERFVRSFKEIQLKERSSEKDKIDFEFLNGKVIIEDGIAVNSGDFDGLKTPEFKEKITKWLEKKGFGKKAINYKLRDWIFSRQHYWGEPIPLIHCQKCGVVAVPEKDLPVELPFVEKYQPTGTGESPLSAIEEWVNVKCPECGEAARRETDTMPNWAGSNWYYLAYAMPKIQNDNSKSKIKESKEIEYIWDKKTMKYWMPIDWYNGGFEHVTLHLLYSRFVYKFLYDIGAAPHKEPYQRRTCHGIILAEDNRKMSKSFGNVINPDDIIKEFGADALRLYEMFIGPFDQAVAWNTNGLRGVYRFLERTWNLCDGYEKLPENSSPEVLRATHKLIRKINSELELTKFNTIVAGFMELANLFYEKKSDAGKDAINRLVLMLAPFAPHLAEEMWQAIGEKESIHLQEWPKFDEKLAKDEIITIVVQINGKVRDKVEVEASASEKQIKEIALASEKTKKWLENQEIKKSIFVKGKLLNLLTK